MGGEGSMSSANQSLKQNRALLKEARHKKRKDLYSYESETNELQFKKVSPERLRIIKNKIRLQHKKNKRRDFIISMLVILVITILLILFLF